MPDNRSNLAPQPSPAPKPAEAGIEIHLIPNAHLDPAWLWDWREGFTEMITTTRTILDLMDEYPQLTFIRGEAFFYRQVEQHDPPAFRRIQELVENKRWDVVGGTLLQSDMNLPATETFIRHLLYGQRYFQERFGFKARAGWSADCFGHSAPLPDLFAGAGIEYYAYTRPVGVPSQNTFWWEGPAGARLLVHHPASGSYTGERDDIRAQLDKLLLHSANLPYHSVACFMGLGNHGGHPTRRQIAEAQSWASEHPQVQVIFSTLTRFGDALRREWDASGQTLFPVFSNEINFAPRGIYAANARFKTAYRKVEANLQRMDKMVSSIAAASGAAPLEMWSAWEAVLFNTFHDILPGSSIERVYDEQLDWLGSAAHALRQNEHQAIQILSSRVDTRVSLPAADMPAPVPFLVFNPHPWPYVGQIELEANLDYRPIWKYAACPDQLPVTVYDPLEGLLPYQFIEMENIYLPRINFRKRVVVPIQLPPLGWKLLEYAYSEGSEAAPVQSLVAAQVASIRNELWEVGAQVGDHGIEIRRAGKLIFSGPGLQAVTVEDPWGPWGDFEDSPASLSLTEVRDLWKVTRVEAGEHGPLRAALHVRLEGGRSRLDLTLTLFQGRDALDVKARGLWDERCARLKLCLPGGYTSATYAVMGGSVERPSCGEVPGGRWVKLHGGIEHLGFASDALYGYNLTPDGDLQASVVRASRYTHEGRADLEDFPWYPVMDCGELRFNFTLTTDLDILPNLADELEQPPLVAQVSPGPGEWGRSGSLGGLSPQTVRLLTVKPAESASGWVIRLQSTSSQVETPRWTWLGTEMRLPPILPHEVMTFLIQKQSGAWSADPIQLTLLEEPDETLRD